LEVGFSAAAVRVGFDASARIAEAGLGAAVSARAAAAGLGAAEVLGFCAAAVRGGCGAVAVAGLAACDALLGGESALAVVPAELDSHVDDSFKPPSGGVA
jgi:hypothetical protein